MSRTAQTLKNEPNTANRIPDERVRSPGPRGPGEPRSKTPPRARARRRWSHPCRLPTSTPLCGERRPSAGSTPRQGRGRLAGRPAALKAMASPRSGVEEDRRNPGCTPERTRRRLRESRRALTTGRRVTDGHRGGRGEGRRVSQAFWLRSLTGPPEGPTGRSRSGPGQRLDVAGSVLLLLALD